MGQTKLDTNSTRYPECSICIANYNGEVFIENCINSVLKQECDFSYEIIVHDDASKDDSVKLLRSTFPEINLIESEQNVGFCESSNRMASAATGTYILHLNNDAELLPDALSTLHRYARELGKPAILTLPQYDYETGELVDRGSLVDLFLNPVPNLDPVRKEVAMVIGACLWVPRALWNQLGGFPDWFESLSEDLYLCALARTQGLPVHALSDSGYRHRSGASFGGGKVVANRLNTTRRRRRLSERNKSYTMFLSYPAPWFQIILPLHLLALLIEGCLLFLIKRDAALWREIYWNCVRELWRNRRRLRGHRKAVQRQRLVTAPQFFSTTVFMPRKLTMLFKYGVPGIE